MLKNGIVRWIIPLKRRKISMYKHLTKIRERNFRIFRLARTKFVFLEQLISLWRLLSVKVCCFRVLSSNIGRKIKQLSAIFFHFRVVVRKVTRNNENSSYLPLNWRVIMRLSKYHQDKGRLFPSVKWKIEYLFDHQKCVTNSRCTASNCNCQYV